MRTGLAHALPAVAFLLATPAWAADCKPLQLMTSIPLTLQPSGEVSMPVSIEGVTEEFLFDTGGQFPQLSQKVVDDLKLPKLDTPYQFYGASGGRSDHITSVKNFQFGTMRTKLDLPISPFGDINIFSPVVFPAYDFDLDLAGKKLNVLSGDHCEGKVIYWPATAVAVVPITIRDYHITVPVTLDGHDLTAVIDTGAPTSTVRLDIARYVFKIDAQSPDLKVAGHLGDNEKAVVYSYPFKSLTFEGITVQNPKIAVLTDVVNENASHALQTGSHIKTVSDDLKLPEVIVGMDVLSKLHVYMAFKESRLYLTPATPPKPGP